MMIARYLVAALALCLCACQSARESVKAAASTEPAPQTAIVKSSNDVREYRSIILDNKLEVVLVSDPLLKKSAAALSVAVGSFQEPKGFGGLAHYLEHMVFLGTTTYPDAAEHAKFISLNGGVENAYTALDHTNYMVAVDNAVFDQALDRFASFFYEALLDERFADKERNAVHSEWTFKGPNDGVILESLDGITLNTDHPVSQFNWGNLESLADRSDQSLHTALVDFYQRYYSANLMKAALISPMSLDEIEVLAKKTLGKITNYGNHRQRGIFLLNLMATHFNEVDRYIDWQEML